MRGSAPVVGLPAGDFLNVRLGGAVASDTWSVGWWFQMTGLGAVPSPSAMNTAAAGPLGGFNNTVWNVAGTPLKVRESTATTLSNSSLYLYRDGVLVASGKASISAVAGTGSTGGFNYVARVVTLLTSQPGRSKRGRIYLPWTGQDVAAATGLWTAEATILSNLAGHLNAEQGAGYFFGGSETADLVVVSSRHAYATSVTQLRMDNKPDTQRGRLNKLVPSVYDTASIS